MTESANYNWKLKQRFAVKHDIKSRTLTARFKHGTILWFAVCKKRKSLDAPLYRNRSFNIEARLIIFYAHKNNEALHFQTIIQTRSWQI